MMRQNAGVLISVAATILATSGCSPFQAKLHRRDTGNQVSQHVQPASYNARPAEPQPRPGMDGLPIGRPSPKKVEVDEKTQQWIALARLSERRDQYDQAENIYAQILERVPDHPLPYHRMAIMRAKQSKFEEAEKYFAKAYELNPSDATLLSDIGYFYYLTSDSARAEQFLRYALQIDPQHEAAHNNLAVLVGEHGDLDEARKYFRRVGNESQTETNMAFVYAQRGELAQAVNSYSRALTLDKDNRPAAYALLSLASHKPRQAAGPTRGSETPQTPSSHGQPSVIDVSSSSVRQPEPAPPTQPYRPAEITVGQPAALDRGVAVVNQPAHARPEKALLTHLSDFARSLRNERPTQPAAAEFREQHSTPSPTAPQSEVTVQGQTPAAREPALAVLGDIRQADPVARSAAADDDEPSASHSDAATPTEDEEPLTSVTDNERSAPTCPPLTAVKQAEASAGRSVAPLGRLQHRLNRLRYDDGENGDHDSTPPESRSVIVYQSPDFRPTVSVSISDKPAEGVSPAGYSPAKEEETKPAATGPAETLPASTEIDASAKLPDSLHPQSSDDRSAEDSPGEVNSFLNSWLMPETPRESSRRGANHSSRRGA